MRKIHIVYTLVMLLPALASGQTPGRDGLLTRHELLETIDASRQHPIFGSPEFCSWQKCSDKTDCVAVRVDHCGLMVAGNAKSVDQIRAYFNDPSIIVDCFALEKEIATPEARCVAGQCRLPSNRGTDFCLQGERSRVIIKRCLQGEKNLCPEAATRAEVWAFEPREEKLLSVGCNLNHDLSCHLLGMRHEEDEEAALYLVRACNNGYAASCYQMGERFGKGDPFEGWYFRACEADAAYCALIAKRLSFSRDVSPDRQARILRYWYGLGCEKGDAEACGLKSSLERKQEDLIRTAQRHRQQALAAQGVLDMLIRENPDELDGAVLIWSGPVSGSSHSGMYAIQFTTPDGEVHSLTYPVPRD